MLLCALWLKENYLHTSDNEELLMQLINNKKRDENNTQ